MIELVAIKQIFLSVLLVLGCAVISFLLGFKLENKMLVGVVRAIVQLVLLSFILDKIFTYNNASTFLIAIFVMTLIASYTAVKRVSKSHKGIFSGAFFSIFMSIFITGTYTVFLSIPQSPWYDTTKSIPLMGMILGNSLTGVSLCMDKFIQEIVLKRNRLDDLFSSGATRLEASREIITNSIRIGMTPIMNAMMVVGIVSIPGMMTGQILAGGSPFDAAKDQIIILLMIASSAFISTFCVSMVSFFRFFDKDHRYNEKLFMEVQ